MKAKKVLISIVIILLVVAIIITSVLLVKQKKVKQSVSSGVTSSQSGTFYTITNQPLEGAKHPIQGCVVMDLTGAHLSKSDLRSSAKILNELTTDFNQIVFSYQPNSKDFSSQLARYYFNSTSAQSNELNIYPIFKELHMQSKFHSFQMKTCQFRQLATGERYADVTGFVDATYGSWWLDTHPYNTACKFTYVQTSSGAWKLLYASITDVFTPKGFKMYFQPKTDYSSVMYSGNEVFKWNFDDIDGFLSGESI